jgi:PAS domain S-box-containing protein
MDMNSLNILEAMPVGVIVTDLTGRIRTCNAYAKSCLDLTNDRMENLRLQDWIDGHRLDPSSFISTVSDSPDKGFKTVIKKDRIFEIAASPLKDADGQPAGAIVIIKDDTEAERRRELTAKKQQYSALEEFSADIAHEIRNPLGSIELYASLLKKELKRKKDIHRVNQIMAAAKIVENKIANLILLSKNFDIPAKPFNLHAILKDILLSSEQIIEEGTVFLSVKYADCEPIVDCNPDLIKQVFLNLILNALQSMPEKGRLDIETRYDPEQKGIDIYFIENAPDNLECAPSRILSRFSRTNDKSSHLGLAIVHNIINIYQGSLKIEYLEGIGTAFVLSFPISSKEPLQKQ